ATDSAASLRSACLKPWHAVRLCFAHPGSTPKLCSVPGRTICVFPTAGPWKLKCDTCWPMMPPACSWQETVCKLSRAAIPVCIGRFSSWISTRNSKNENLRFRVQPDIILLERGGHLLSRDLQEFVQARTRHQLCRT